MLEKYNRTIFFLWLVIIHPMGAVVCSSLHQPHPKHRPLDDQITGVAKHSRIDRPGIGGSSPVCKQQ